MARGTEELDDHKYKQCHSSSRDRCEGAAFEEGALVRVLLS
jgi:hypothetical protein